MAQFRTSRVAEAFDGDFATSGVYNDRKSNSIVSDWNWYITRYTADGTEAQGDYLPLIVDFPERANLDLYNSYIRISGGSIGTSVTLDIGDNYASGTAGSAIDEDKFVNGLDVSAAGDYALSAGGAASNAQLNPEAYITTRYDTSGNRQDLYSVSDLTDSDRRAYLFAKIATATGNLAASVSITFLLRIKKN